MSIKLKFIILLLTALAPALIKAQGSCSFSIKTQVTPVDCRANGVIAITLEGADLESMQNFMYRAYPEGDNPNDYDFITNNVISGLSEGNYIVEAKAFCTLNGVNVSQQQSNVSVPRTIAYIEPDFTINPNLTRKSLSCLPSGMLHLQGIVKGKGPYTLKLTKIHPTAPTTTIILDNVTTLASTYQIPNLSAGDYEIELSDGCGSAIKRTATIEALSSDFLSTFINSNFYASPSAKDGNCSSLVFYRVNPSSSSDWYYYAINASQFYEYAIYYPGQNENTLSWLPFSNSNTYIPFNTAHSIEDMRADDKTSEKLKIPQICVRIKGGNCDPFFYKPNLTKPALSTTTTTIGCGVQQVSFGVGSGGNSSTTGIICYPYKWLVGERPAGSTQEPVITKESTAGRYSGNRDILVMYPGTEYIITAIGANDDTIPSFKYTPPAQITPSARISASYKTACNDSVSISISSAASLQGGTIQFLTKSGAGVVPPTHTLIHVPETYSGSIYPYSSDYTKPTYIATKDIPTSQLLYFLVTDSCDVSNELSFRGPSSYFFQKEPSLDIDISCGRATIKAPDLNQIFKALHSTTGAVSGGLTVYMKIISAPEGTDIVYSRSAGYLQSTAANNDYVQVSKSGTYRFSVSTSNTFTSTSCYIQFEADIVIPEMKIDEATSAAYRCPGSAIGTGYMNIKVENGSGNYKFTLYSQNNPNTAIATSNTGVFTSWPATTSDYYIIKIEDLSCGRSMTHSVFVYDLGNATLGWPENNVFIKCLGDKIKLYSLALGETSYSWTGPGGWSSTERNPEIPETTLAHSGTYTITVQVPGCGPDAVVSYSFILSVADKVMYWNPDAVDNNWYNTTNWLTSTSEQAMAVPAPCTTVHIAGNSTMYPNLDMASTPRDQYGFPSCDTIIFHYGSETIYPHFLKYNRAKVQYNFNHYQTYALDSQPTRSKDYNKYPDAQLGGVVPTLNRSQWYSISAPLKHITGGDFGLGGYPNFYQRLYNSTDPQRGFAAKDSYTLSFNTQNIDLKTTGHAMALWVPNYDPTYLGLGDHKHLQGLEGIIELPYFLNPQIMANRPLNQYNVADSTSLFQYYDENSPGLEPVMQWDTYQRGYQAFRFVFENDNDTVSIHNVNGVNVAGYRLELPVPTQNTSTRRVMIGNPLMCHINFDKIYEANSDIIEDFYMITEGATETFRNYRVASANNDLPNNIPPLQGFIVTLKASPNGNSLLLPFEGSMSVITPSPDGFALPKPRSSQENKNSGWFNIVASTPPRTGLMKTADRVQTRATLLINQDVQNIPKIMFPDGLDYKAEVFLIGNDGYLNAEQVEHGYPEVVKFGIESTFKENISLQFSKQTNGVIDKVILVDKYLNETKDISETGVYTFKHRYAYNKGIDNDRFELRITYNASSISNENNAPIIICANRDKLIAESSAILNSVYLHNTLGESIVAKTDIGTTSYTEIISLEPGVYIATATLAGSNTVVTQKIIVR